MLSGIAPVKLFDFTERSRKFDNEPSESATTGTVQ